MGFDPTRDPVAPRDAATVILLRPREADGEAEVFLLRRHRKSSFMAQSFVFPGGAVDEGEDARLAAARELFEEAGVLLTSTPASPEVLAGLRAQLAEQGSAALASLLDGAGLALDLDALTPFSHWITPSAESKRFSARFFAAVLPTGQTPSFDNVETVDEAWVTPAEALGRNAELRLPPPQLRTLIELIPVASQGPEAVLDLARARAAEICPIVPRLLQDEAAPKGFVLLCPWDPDYAERGLGEGQPVAADHPFAGGPSRFVLDAEQVWDHV
jgi:8-oxo-dGTP pyrophosphatase MutT (NUDIX family)